MPTVLSTSRPTPDDFASRKIGGKQRFFGKFRGERDEQNQFYVAYRSAIDSATTLEQTKTELDSNEDLSDQGKLNALRDATEDFFRAKIAFREAAANERERLAKHTSKIYSLDEYNVATDMQHHRLIEAFRALPQKERNLLLLPDRLKSKPALARALVAEDPLVTGLSSEETDRARDALLSDDNRVKLAQATFTEQQIATTERAFDAATQVTAELAELTEGDVNEIEAAIADTIKQEPPPDDTKPLSQGGAIPLATIDDDDEHEEDEHAA